MKVLAVISIGLFLICFSSCSANGQSSTPPLPSVTPNNSAITLTRIPGTPPAGSSTNQTEAYDDIIPTPGGWAYRGNVHQEGVPDKWPTVQTIVKNLFTVKGNISLYFRDWIVTKAGEERNEIFIVLNISQSSVNNTIELSAVHLPDGITLGNYDTAFLPGLAEASFAIYIAPEVTPGGYNIYINVTFNDIDYDTVICHVIVADGAEIYKVAPALT